MKITVVCQMGLGSSFMLEMTIKDVLKELGVEADVDHLDITSAKMSDADIFIGAQDVIDQLDKENKIGLVDILNKELITEKLSHLK